jgi:putative acetyltransferase
MTEANLDLRPATAADIPGIVALIDSVYREYGDAVCLENADRDLPQAHTYYAEHGGAFVVLADGGKVVGTHAALPLDAATGLCTFRRLYLDPSLRGAGAGERLMHWALDWARQHGFRRVEFWSDTRFARAHRFFQRFGFARDGRTRELNDAYAPYWEYFFYLDL